MGVSRLGTLPHRQDLSVRRSAGPDMVWLARLASDYHRSVLSVSTHTVRGQQVLLAGHATACGAPR